MVASSLRGLVAVCSLLALLAGSDFDTEETNPKKTRCAQGSLHGYEVVEVDEERTLGCRLTLIYDEYFIVRMAYYDYHREGVESRMAMDCDDDGFLSVICDTPMCNLKIGEGLTKGARDTVARNYYLLCLYHKSIQRQPFIDAVLRGITLNVSLLALAVIGLCLVRKYKEAKRQNTIDLVQAYDRKKDYTVKMIAKDKERREREADRQQQSLQHPEEKKEEKK